MGDQGGGGGGAAPAPPRPPLLGVLVGLFCLISGRKKFKTRLSLAL